MTEGSSSVSWNDGHPSMQAFLSSTGEPLEPSNAEILPLKPAEFSQGLSATEYQGSNPRPSLSDIIRDHIRTLPSGIAAVPSSVPVAQGRNLHLPSQSTESPPFPDFIDDTLKAKGQKMEKLKRKKKELMENAKKKQLEPKAQDLSMRVPRLALSRDWSGMKPCQNSRTSRSDDGNSISRKEEPHCSSSAGSTNSGQSLNTSVSAPSILMDTAFQAINKKANSDRLSKMELLHAKKKCKPCGYFYRKDDGCRQGMACKFCHICPSDELKARKRAKKREFFTRGKTMYSF